jgi:hypothetical protein
MTDRKPPDEMEGATRAALDRLAARKRTLAERVGGPRPGDLYVFENLALDATVSWALVMPHPDDPDSFLAVPADDNPLAGGDDVEVPAGDGSGPLTLRCGHATWIGKRHLTPGRLDGWVDAAILAEARAALRSVAAGDRRGGFEQREIEATADYEDWIAMIAGAEAQLAELLEADERAAEASPAAPPRGLTLWGTVGWGPAPASASSSIVHWTDIELSAPIADFSFALVDGVTDPAQGGTSFRLLQLDGARTPVPRLVLTFFDPRDRAIAVVGDPGGIAPGDTFEVQGIEAPREVARVSARWIG